MKKFCCLLLIVAMVACKKDDDSPTLSLKDVLMKPANGWIRTSALVTIPGSTAQIDAITTPGILDDCEKDEATIFKADGVLQVNNTVKCDASEPSTYAGTWTVSDDQKTLMVTSGDLSYTAAVTEFDESHVKSNVMLTIGGKDVSAVLVIKPQ